MNDRKVTQFGTEMISHGNRFIREREVIEFHFSKHGELFALCDDDTLWLYDEEGDEWKRITNVPGTEWMAAETSEPQCGPKKPTEPGWYWHINTAGHKSVVEVYVHESMGGELFARLYNSGSCEYLARVDDDKWWGPKVEEWKTDIDGSSAR